jgi:hypothetical protein
MRRFQTIIAINFETRRGACRIAVCAEGGKLVIEGPSYDQYDHAGDAISAGNHAHFIARSAILRKPSTENLKPPRTGDKLFPRENSAPCTRRAS